MLGGDLIVVNAAVWSRPEAEMIQDRAVIVRGGRIDAVLAMPDAARLPEGIPVLDAGGRVLTAGFWNCHVHLIEPVWSNAGRSNATTLQRALVEMFISRGFTSVVDLASNSRDTLSLIARIESGELSGPSIRTAAEAIRPARGIPFYTKESVPWYLWWALPTPWTARGARHVARRQIRKGAHVIKLFTGSYVKRDRVKVMKPKIACAAAAAAHEHGVLVFAHTSNQDGLKVALDAGVDVIAHVPKEADVTDSLLRACAEKQVWMIPTLHMFAHTVTSAPSYLDPIDAALRTFIAAAGRILFGTDVGYMDDYDTSGDLTALHRCGLGTAEILPSLTTEPATAFGCTDLGAVEPGMVADLTLLDTTSQQVTPSELSRIAAVVKNGRVIHKADDLT